MNRLRPILLMAAAMSALVSAQTPILSLTAITDNVSGANDTIRIDVLRWSTDAERDQLLAAWNLTAPPVTNGRSGRGGRGGRGAVDPAPDPAAVNLAPAAGRGAAGRAGGRAGRGGGRAIAPDAPPATPESSLKAALGKAPIVGHLWSSEVAGYSLRAAIRLTGADGGERILLITDRRLGAWNDLWKPAGADGSTNYEFSVVELHLNSKDEGEGKVSLTGKVTVDSAAKALALDNYGGLPVVLKSVRRRSSGGL
jgi:hypothetical protein